MRSAMMVMFLVFLGVAESDAGGRHGTAWHVFATSLQSHGEWIAIDNGVSVWRPFKVPRGWKPYTIGRWAWTNHGWYWVSSEPWGHVTYHYGRWYYDDYYGWVWVPDDEWGPAWVDWDCRGEYVGWAPMGPATLVRFSLFLGMRPIWAVHKPHWTVVYYHQMKEPNIQKHLRPEREVRTFGNGWISGGGNRGERLTPRWPDPSEVDKRARVSPERIDAGVVEKTRKPSPGSTERDQREPVRKGDRFETGGSGGRTISGAGGTRTVGMKENNRVLQGSRVPKAEEARRSENHREARSDRVPTR